MGKLQAFGNIQEEASESMESLEGSKTSKALQVRERRVPLPPQREVYLECIGGSVPVLKAKLAPTERNQAGCLRQEGKLHHQKHSGNPLKDVGQIEDVSNRISEDEQQEPIRKKKHKSKSSKHGKDSSSHHRHSGQQVGE